MQIETKTAQPIELPLEQFQNADAQSNWGYYNENQCCLCGKKVGKNPSYVHYLTNGNITSEQDDSKIPNSQGCFPVGSECAKKLPAVFVFKLNA